MCEQRSDQGASPQDELPLDLDRELTYGYLLHVLDANDERVRDKRDDRPQGVIDEQCSEEQEDK